MNLSDSAMDSIKVLLVVLMVPVVLPQKQLHELVFPKGSSFVITVAIGNLFPKDLAEGFAQIVEFDLIYPVVPKPTPKKKTSERVNWTEFYLNRKNLEIERFYRNKAVKEQQRESIRLQLEDAINRFGYDGPGCVYRFECELNQISRPSSILEDLLLIMFRRRNLFCNNSHKYCPFSLLQIVLNSEEVRNMAIGLN